MLCKIHLNIHQQQASRQFLDVPIYQQSKPNLNIKNALDLCFYLNTIYDDQILEAKTHARRVPA